MKKQILNIGDALNKTEQKQIMGGRGFGISDGECDQLSQQEIVCDPYSPINFCDLDAICLDLGSGNGRCHCPEN